jgi:hypothetical protein
MAGLVRDSAFGPYSSFADPSASVQVLHVNGYTWSTHNVWQWPPLRTFSSMLSNVSCVDDAVSMFGMGTSSWETFWGPLTLTRTSNDTEVVMATAIPGYTGNGHVRLCRLSCPPTAAQQAAYVDLTLPSYAVAPGTTADSAPIVAPVAGARNGALYVHLSGSLNYIE